MNNGLQVRVLALVPPVGAIDEWDIACILQVSLSELKNTLEKMPQLELLESVNVFENREDKRIITLYNREWRRVNEE
ncbi:MAG: hypothetical protein RLZZ148_677 [Cyanobacteriota bacterium]